jgi:hypothetical protein
VDALYSLLQKYLPFSNRTIIYMKAGDICPFSRFFKQDTEEQNGSHKD